jgi:hypothetical protein
MSDLNPFREPAFWYLIITMTIVGFIIGSFIVAATMAR